MRVAFFQRFFAHYQGGLVEALRDSKKHEYCFFGDRQDPCNTGIEAYSFDENMRYQPCQTWHQTRHLAWQWRAVRAACDSRFDAVILEGSFTFPTNWLALAIARATGKKTFLYGHGWLRHDTGWKRYVRAAFYRWADGLLLYGRRARQIGIGLGFAPAKLYVVFNSLNEKNILAQRQSVTEAKCQALRQELFGAEHHRPILLSVGRLTASKRLGLLLEAARLMGRQGSPVNVHVVGVGPERTLLQESARRWGLNVRFSGAIHDEALLSLIFSAADTTVIPGAAGLSVIHSLAYGTPVVTHGDLDTQMPETEAVIPGQTGFFFRKGDATDLGRAITQVLARLPRGEATRRQCRHLVDTCYNPRRMREVFDRAIAGQPATADEPEGRI